MNAECRMQNAEWGKVFCFVRSRALTLCLRHALADGLCSFFLIRERINQEIRAGICFKVCGVFSLPAPKNFAEQNSSHRTEKFDWGLMPSGNPQRKNSFCVVVLMENRFRQAESTSFHVRSRKHESIATPTRKCYARCISKSSCPLLRTRFRTDFKQKRESISFCPILHSAFCIFFVCYLFVILHEKFYFLIFKSSGNVQENVL